MRTVVHEGVEGYVYLPEDAVSNLDALRLALGILAIEVLGLDALNGGRDAVEEAVNGNAWERNVDIFDDKQKLFCAFRVCPGQGWASGHVDVLGWERIAVHWASDGDSGFDALEDGLTSECCVVVALRV